MINGSLFQSVWALRTVAATHPPPQATWQAAVQVFLEQLAHGLQKPGWVKGPCPSKAGICVLIVSCCFWSQRCKRGRQLLLYFPPLLQAPLPPAEVTSRRFKGLVTSFSPFIFRFSPFGSQALKIGENSLWLWISKERLRIDIRRHWHRDSLQPPKEKEKQRIANPRGGGESDFQSYHIIKFKCSVFNLKS